MSAIAGGGPLFIGLDVGTGSARAGVFDRHGRLLASAERPIRIYRVRGQPLLYQQASEDIWRALCASLREALAGASGAGGRVAALSVTATCSMVVMGQGGATPLDVTPTGAETDTPPASAERATADSFGNDDRPNIIMWLDHRALAEAAAITGTGHPMLRHVGGVVSPENEIPKLLWLKRHRPDIYQDPATRYYDLADYLSLRLAGRVGAGAGAGAGAGEEGDVRSLCCVGAKWMYDTAGGQWDRTFLQAIGLEDLDSSTQLGAAVKRPGEGLGPIDPTLASDLGLAPTAVVAVGTVDAFAGVIGSVGARLPVVVEGAAAAGAAAAEAEEDLPLERRLAVIMGTSSCHLCCSPSPHLIPGVWGPFRDALGNGMWVAEGGQSATGKLLDHLLQTHPAWGELQAEAAAAGQHPQQFLHARLEALAEAEADDSTTTSSTKVALLAKDVHVLPHWAGSRSPDADPGLTGAVVGLTFDTSLDALARLYLAAVQALALGTKHIVDALEGGGHGPISHLFVSGGLGVKNRLLLQAHADATGRALVLPGGSDEAVLLGAAVVAAVAAGAYPSVDAGMAGMTTAGAVVAPDGDPAVRALYAAKEAVYHELRELQLKARARTGDL